MEAFARKYFGGAVDDQDALYHVLRPIVQRYEEEQRDFHSALSDFVRKFAFLAQIVRFTDADLENL